MEGKTNYRFGDIVQYADRKEQYIIAGFMAYSRDVAVIVPEDQPSVLGMPVNVCHLRGVVGRDTEWAQRISRRFRKRLPNQLSPDNITQENE